MEALRTSIRPPEAVQEVNDDDHGNEMLDVDDNAAGALLAGQAEPDLPWTNDLAFSPSKRRRIHNEDEHASAEQHHTNSLESRLTSEATRFTKTFAAPGQHPNFIESGDLHRPAFLRPPQQPHPITEPLPEAFSPHRRGQKFVPGGMAATVQQWVLETGQAAAQSRRGQGHQHGEDYIMRAKVESAVESSGSFSVRARLPDGRSLDFLLAGGRGSNSLPSSQIVPGAVIGIRAPTWEVELDGKMWTVAVDWRVVA